MPVQFLVVGIFDLLEEQLGEAEDFEVAFPRKGLRAIVWLMRAHRQGSPTCPTRLGGGDPLPSTTHPERHCGHPGGQAWAMASPDPTLPRTFLCYRCGEFGHRYRDCQNEACTWPAGKGKGKGKGNISPRRKSTAGGGGVSQHPHPVRELLHRPHQ